MLLVLVEVLIYVFLGFILISNNWFSSILSYSLLVRTVFNISFGISLFSWILNGRLINVTGWLEIISMKVYIRFINVIKLFISYQSISYSSRLLDVHNWLMLWFNLLQFIYLMVTIFTNSSVWLIRYLSLYYL